MTKVADIALKVRSKNAGPFWVTIDVFCGTAEAFETLRAALKTEEGVLDAEPNYLLELCYTPTDPLYASQSDALARGIKTNLHRGKFW